MEEERMEDASISSPPLLVDLYCHEVPLVSTPPAMTLPAAAAASLLEEVGGDHRQQVQDLLLLVDRESLMAEYMARQRCHAPSRCYLDHLSRQHSAYCSSSVHPDDHLSLSYARSRGVRYIVYAFDRLGLAAATAFNAVNYLDRFLSINCHIQRWETWMVELVSLACLSIACKLEEVRIPSIHQLQMEELMSHSFRPATIRDMELTLLKALQWRIACVTPFSFLQLLIITCTETAAASRCTRLLIRSLSETSLLQFEPSVVASSALRCVLLQDHQQHDNVTMSSLLTRPADCCPLLVTAMKQDNNDSDECFNTMKALYASMDHREMYSRSQQQHLTFPCGGINRRSAVGRRLVFGRSTPPQLIRTEHEDI